MQSMKSGMQYLKVLRPKKKKKTNQLRILYPVKLFKSEGESFSDKQKLGKLIASRPALQK